MFIGVGRVSINGVRFRVVDGIEVISGYVRVVICCSKYIRIDVGDEVGYYVVGG